MRIETKLFSSISSTSMCSTIFPFPLIIVIHLQEETSSKENILAIIVIILKCLQKFLLANRTYEHCGCCYFLHHISLTSGQARIK